MPLKSEPLLPKPKDWALLTVALRKSLSPDLTQLLKSIDDDLKLYDEAFSNMAKRNLSADIEHDVNAWSLKWKTNKPTTPVPDLIRRLGEQAKDAVVATGGVSGRRYTDAVCVGYRVATGSFDASNFVRYGGQADDRADMMLRCGQMTTAVREAWDACEAKYPSGNANLGYSWGAQIQRWRNPMYWPMRGKAAASQTTFFVGVPSSPPRDCPTLFPTKWKG
jgi:hypothetical protein